MSKSKLLIALLLIASFCASSAFSQDAPRETPRPLKCVYFTPSDCKPYPDRAERLFRVMTYVQEFYRREMERNGFGPLTFELEEATPGKLKLYEVRAPKPMVEYGRESAWSVRAVVADALKKQGIDVGKEVIVIFQQGLLWKDGKAEEVSSFVGSGSPFNGTAWFYDDPMLDPDKLSSKEPGGYYHRPCSVGEFNSHYIGGIAHELGHALTLPHDCETSVERAALGSALMGGGNHTFGRELRGEGKGAFLTYSEALRLSVVPAISGQTPQRRALDVSLVDLRAKRSGERSVTLTGKIETARPVLGVIVYDDLDSRASDYDAKTWCVRPNEDGTFTVELTEVAPEPSELRVCVVRDVDTQLLFRVALNPDGSENEFDPIASSMTLRKISTAFSEKDVAALTKLAEKDYANDEAAQTLCRDLVKVLAKTNSTALDSPKEAAASDASFNLTNASFTRENVGWSRLTRNAHFDGSLLQVGGRGFASGLSAHAPSVLETSLGRKWKRFEFSYGLQSGSPGSVVFVVRGDGRELFRSAVVKDHDLHTESVDVSNVDVLQLVTEDGGNGNTSDHSLWIEPILTR